MTTPVTDVRGNGAAHTGSRHPQPRPRLGPNDRQPCGTHGARVRHTARGRRWQCPECWPDEAPR